MADRIHIDDPFSALTTSVNATINDQSNTANATSNVHSVVESLPPLFTPAGLDTERIGSGDVSNATLAYLTGVAQPILNQLGTEMNLDDTRPGILHMIGTPGTNIGLWRNTSSTPSNNMRVQETALGTGFTKTTWEYLTGLGYNGMTDLTVGDVGRTGRNAADYTRAGVSATDEGTLVNQLTILLDDVEDMSTNNPLAAGQLNANLIADRSISNAEFDALDGLTSPIQDQLNTSNALITGLGEIDDGNVKIDAARISSGVTNANFNALANVSQTIPLQTFINNIDSRITSVNLGNTELIGNGGVNQAAFDSIEGLTGNLKDQLDGLNKLYASFVSGGNIIETSIEGRRTELSYLSGTMGNMQNQLDVVYKRLDSMGAISGNSLTIDVTKIAGGSVTNTEFGYINGLTGNAQTQINDLQGYLNSLSDGDDDTAFTGNVSAAVIGAGITNAEWDTISGLTKNLQEQIDEGIRTSTGVSNIGTSDDFNSRLLQSYTEVNSEAASFGSWEPLTGGASFYYMDVDDVNGSYNATAAAQDIWPAGVAGSDVSYYGDLASDGTSLICSQVSKRKDAGPQLRTVNGDGEVQTVEGFVDSNSGPYPLQVDDPTKLTLVAYRDTDNPTDVANRIRTETLTNDLQSQAHLDLVEVDRNKIDIDSEAANYIFRRSFGSDYVNYGQRVSLPALNTPNLTYYLWNGLRYDNQYIGTNILEANTTTGAIGSATGFRTYGNAHEIESNWSANVSLSGTADVNVQIKGFSGTNLTNRDVVQSRRDFLNTGLVYDTENSRWLASGIIRWYDLLADGNGTARYMVVKFQRNVIIPIGSNDFFDSDVVCRIRGLDNWVPARVYAVNDIVAFRSNVNSNFQAFRCILARTVDNTDHPEDDTTGWELIPTWASGGVYAINDYVVYDEKVYRCRVARTASNTNNPSIDVTGWEFYYAVILDEDFLQTRSQWIAYIKNAYGSCTSDSFVVPPISAENAFYDWRTSINAMAYMDGYLFYVVGPLADSVGGGWELRVAELGSNTTASDTYVVPLVSARTGEAINTRTSKIDSMPVSLTVVGNTLVGVDRHDRFHYFRQNARGEWTRIIDPQQTSGFTPTAAHTSLYRASAGDWGRLNAIRGIEYHGGKMYVLRDGKPLETIDYNEPSFTLTGTGIGAVELGF